DEPPAVRGMGTEDRRHRLMVRVELRLRDDDERVEDERAERSDPREVREDGETAGASRERRRRQDREQRPRAEDAVAPAPQERREPGDQHEPAVVLLEDAAED